MPTLSLKGKSIHSNPFLIILDKDGTLIDIHHYWAEMIRLRSRKAVTNWVPSQSLKQVVYDRLIDAMGIISQTARLKRNGPVGVKPRSFVVQTVKQVLEEFEISKTHNEVEQLFQEIDGETSKNLSPLLRVLPGVTAFLEACQSNGIRLAVVTTDLTHRAETALESLGLQRYFDFILGGDRVTRHKPAPDPAQIAMDEMEVGPDDTVVIGDHPVDIEMGKSAGTSCNIAVLTGLGEPEDFSQCHLMSSFTELGVSR